jgi:hypothetical protein
MLEFGLFHGCSGIFVDTPHGLSHTNKVLVINNRQGEVLLVEAPLLISGNLNYGLAVIAQTVSEWLEDLIFGLISLNKVAVSGDIVAVAQTGESYGAITFWDFLPGGTDDSSTAALKSRSQSSEEVVNREGTVWIKSFHECLHLDLGGEDSELSEDALELGSADLSAALIKGEREGSEGNSLLLLDLHSEVADDAVGLDVEADAEKVRHF